MVGLLDDVAALGKLAAASLPIVRRIATGSLRNELLFILPVAIVLSQVAPTLVEIILMADGVFLCYEGAQDRPRPAKRRPRPRRAGGDPRTRS